MTVSAPEVLAAVERAVDLWDDGWRRVALWRLHRAAPDVSSQFGLVVCLAHMIVEAITPPGLEVAVTSVSAARPDQQLAAAMIAAEANDDMAGGLDAWRSADWAERRTAIDVMFGSLMQVLDR